MAQIEILLPKMGESVAEATIIKWLVEEGQTVEADDPIVEIATDKVDSEVPAPEDGVITKILVGEDDVVQVGQPIAMFSADGDAPAATPAPAAEAATAPAPTPAAVAEPAAEVLETVTAPLTESVSKNGPSGRFYSPLVRNIAKAEGIGMAELEAISGSGKEGRVTKSDILGYLENRGADPAPAPAPAAAPSKASSNGQAKAKPVPAPVSLDGGDEIVEMDRMRKLIADHMVMSKQTSPHVTSFVEADVTNLVLWRNKVKGEFQQ